MFPQPRLLKEIPVRRHLLKNTKKFQLQVAVIIKMVLLRTKREKIN